MENLLKTGIRLCASNLPHAGLRLCRSRKKLAGTNLHLPIDSEPKLEK